MTIKMVPSDVWIIPAHVSELVIEEGMYEPWSNRGELPPEDAMPEKMTCYKIRMTNMNGYSVSKATFKRVSHILASSRKYEYNAPIQILANRKTVADPINDEEDRDREWRVKDGAG